MGGTTAKVCVIRDGRPEVTSRFWVGGQIFIGAPVMDMVEIGAGGGSIAWIDQAGAVHVGPQSAGAVPGPGLLPHGRHRAHGDRCGPRPWLHQRRLLPGRRHGSGRRGGPRRASRRGSATVWVSSVPEAAHGIYRLVNANMIGRHAGRHRPEGPRPPGFQPGGLGGHGRHPCRPHGSGTAHPRVIVPLNAGVFSALGLITADARYDVHRSYVARGSQADPERMEAIFDEISPGGGGRRSKSWGSYGRTVGVRYEIDMRYLGQAHEVPVEIPAEMARGHARRPRWRPASTCSTRNTWTCSGTRP